MKSPPQGLRVQVLCGEAEMPGWPWPLRWRELCLGREAALSLRQGRAPIPHVSRPLLLRAQPSVSGDTAREQDRNRRCASALPLSW